MDGEYRIYFSRQETGAWLKPPYLPFSQTHRINSIFTINRPIVYIYAVVGINMLFTRGIYVSIILKLYACILICYCVGLKKICDYTKHHFKMNILYVRSHDMPFLLFLFLD